MQNLVAVARPVHNSINRVWTVVRSQRGVSIGTKEVERVADITRQRLGHWFNKPFRETPDALNELAAAEQGAIEEVRRLFAQAGG